MSDLLQDTLTKELALKNNDLQIVTGRAAIRQDCEQVLKFLYGEWFLDTTKGVPYFQSVLVKSPDLNVIQGIFIEAILSVNGVMELLSFVFNYDPETRVLSITFEARTTDGTISVEQTLEAAA